MAKLGVCLLFFLITVCCLSVVKASAISLGQMIAYEDPKIKTLFDAYREYNNYGCYCGLGGKGEPVDPIDCCCWKHDKCYDDLATDDCKKENEIATTYNFKKYHHAGKPHVDCSSAQEGCPRKICLCDARVAECFAQNNARHYNPKHSNYDRNNKCGETRTYESSFCPSLP
ncbi:phospholipase A2, minor isoenzyme-like [Diadema antillarum]|uniref:phospholipase A2, minor isoenzyme-like n=1 Tax=Diadema antillarum TaxID=105358 RepID=UPI003A8BC6AF